MQLAAFAGTRAATPLPLWSQEHASYEESEAQLLRHHRSEKRRYGVPDLSLD